MDLVTAPPPNLSLDPKVRTAMVENDLYNICERIRELDPNLRIIHLDDDETQKFVIMEMCKDGVERMVMKADELDARIIQRLEYILRTPLDQRLAEIDKIEKAARLAKEEEEAERLYEEIGRPMWTMLDKLGFNDGRGVSYPKTSPKRKG